VGGPMREIARFSGASIVGINNNAYQVERVSVYNERTGLQNIAQAVKVFITYYTRSGDYLTKITKGRLHEYAL
jgi:hypothetical protein